MPRRFLFLVGLCVLVGIATQAFARSMADAPFITREGAVAMIVESKAAWKAEVEAIRNDLPPLPIYDDVDQDEWYAPYVEIAFRHNLIAATDFHRDFRPGELLTQGEAVTLAARYKVNGDVSKLPKEEPDHPLTVPLHVKAAYEMGIDLPSPLETWNVIRRKAWYDLIESAGMKNAEAVVVTLPSPASDPAPLQPLPIAGPVNPSPTQPSNNNTGYKPDETGYKPAESAPTYVQPTYVGNPANAQPVTSGAAYVPNPTGSQPVTSGTNTYVPTPSNTQPVTSGTTSYVANPPGSRPVTSGNNNAPTSGTTTTNAGTSNPAPSTSPNYFSISIPSLGIQDLRVTHPADVTTQNGLLAPLQVGVGHLFGYPGNGGTILVYGHSSSYSWDVSSYTRIFRKINALKPGDRISINYNGKVYNYVMTYAQTVEASDMSAYRGGNGEELVLYTCWPPDDIKQRYLVHAKPV